MAELSQPTSPRLHALAPLVSTEVEKEILYRLESNIRQGARHNHDDVARYNAMWGEHQEAAEAIIEAQRKKAEAERVKAEAQHARDEAEKTKAEKDAKVAEAKAEHQEPPHSTHRR